MKTTKKIVHNTTEGFSCFQSYPCLKDNGQSFQVYPLILISFVFLSDQAEAILQKAFTVGVTSAIDTSSYISESLQLLNLDLQAT